MCAHKSKHYHITSELGESCSEWQLELFSHTRSSVTWWESFRIMLCPGRHLPGGRRCRAAAPWLSHVQCPRETQTPHPTWYKTRETRWGHPICLCFCSRQRQTGAPRVPRPLPAAPLGTREGSEPRAAPSACSGSCGRSEPGRCLLPA